MDTKILKSVASMAAVAVIGVGTSYALFTSGPLTIAASSATTGTANIAICNTDGDNTWKETVSPSLTLDGLIPGGAAVELTEFSNIYIGNDNGELDDNPVDNANGDDEFCTGSDGSSDVTQQIIPSLTTVSCPDDVELEDQLLLSFQLSNGTQTAFQSLNAWEANTASGIVLDPDLIAGQSELVTVMAQLDGDADVQDAECTFDMVFNGTQEAEASPTP